ncbi:DUF2341 domain-containing protein, partial [Candidatus Pacearchaeota archaeon]|nr:DUF2341 domain-containing protein [Candidatus Pacearchaeota archaeon]
MVKKKFKLSFIFLIVFIFGISLENSAFYNNNKSEESSDYNFPPNNIHTSSSNNPPNKHFFQYYKEIIIDRNLVSGTGSHKNFPVLISILDSDLHDDVQSNGNDIAFANDTAWLDHEIELFDQAYNSTHAQLIAWVRIPNLLTSIDTIIRMYYGNSTMSSQENPQGVWNSNYMGVWHLNETSGNAQDSTSYNIEGTPSVGVTQGSSGQIDGCYEFGGIVNEDGVGMGNPVDGHLDFGTGSLTLSSWMAIDGIAANNQMVVFKGGHASDKAGYQFQISDIALELNFRISDGSTLIGTTFKTLSASKWYYVVGVVDKTNAKLRMYIDGSEFNNQDITGLGSIDSTYDFYSSRDWRPAYGKLDEVRVSNGAYSASWIATEFNNQNDPTSFYSIGKEYTVSGNPPNGHYFTYYKEITIDHTMVSGSHDLFNFPLLISTFDEDLQNKAQIDGDDIAFAYNGAW